MDQVCQKLKSKKFSANSRNRLAHFSFFIFDFLLLKKLPRAFYSRPTLCVARDLLGKLIVRKTHRVRLVGRIVEVEAYLAEKDPASHAYRGMTTRNAVMFGHPGHLYVYFTYGMHFCSNVVTETKGKAGAVLIRGVEPIRGISVMQGLRWKKRRMDRKDQRDLTNGPAKFCEAFGIRRKLNGVDLLGREIFLARDKPVRLSEVGRSTRIGIRNGKEKRWRFYLKGNPWVSKG